MRALFAAVLFLTQISAAYAQTEPPAAETPAAEAPATCDDIPPEPQGVNIATASTSQVSAASERQSQWRRAAAAVIECRRLYYNAAIARFNEVNHAWSAQLDAFCARRDIRCSPRDRQETPPQTPAQ